jgi:hypothetical protein
VIKVWHNKTIELDEIPNEVETSLCSQRGAINKDLKLVTNLCTGISFYRITSNGTWNTPFDYKLEEKKLAVDKYNSL